MPAVNVQLVGPANLGHERSWHRDWRYGLYPPRIGSETAAPLPLIPTNAGSHVLLTELISEFVK